MCRRDVMRYFVIRFFYGSSWNRHLLGAPTRYSKNGHGMVKVEHVWIMQIFAMCVLFFIQHTISVKCEKKSNRLFDAWMYYLIRKIKLHAICTCFAFQTRLYVDGCCCCCKWRERNVHICIGVAKTSNFSSAIPLCSSNVWKGLEMSSTLRGKRRRKKKKCRMPCSLLIR